MGIRRNILAVLLFLFVLSSVFYSIGTPIENNSSFQLPPGTAATNFHLTDILSNQTFSLTDFHGKVVIIDLFTTWCPPCRVSIPKMKDIYNCYSIDELTIISVDIDRTENESLVRDFINEFEMDWYVALDNNSIVDNTYGSGYVPTMYIIDQNQTIVYSEIGFHFSNIIDTLNDLSLEPISSLPTYSPPGNFTWFIDFMNALVFVMVCIVVIVILSVVIYVRRRNRNQVTSPSIPIKESYSPNQNRVFTNICPSCRQQLLPQTKFCVFCGVKIKE